MGHFSEYHDQETGFSESDKCRAESDLTASARNSLRRQPDLVPLEELIQFPSVEVHRPSHYVAWQSVVLPPSEESSSVLAQICSRLLQVEPGCLVQIREVSVALRHAPESTTLEQGVSTQHIGVIEVITRDNLARCKISRNY